MGKINNSENNVHGCMHFKASKGGEADKFVSLTSFQGGEIPFPTVATTRDEVRGSQAVDERIVEITPSKLHSAEGRQALSHVRKEGKRGSRKDSVEREERLEPFFYSD